jgi:hypothetical protein
MASFENHLRTAFLLRSVHLRADSTLAWWAFQILAIGTRIARRQPRGFGGSGPGDEQAAAMLAAPEAEYYPC